MTTVLAVQGLRRRPSAPDGFGRQPAPAESAFAVPPPAVPAEQGPSPERSPVLEKAPRPERAPRTSRPRGLVVVEARRPVRWNLQTVAD